MKTEAWEPSRIPEILAAHLKDRRTVFVFSSDIAATSWAEWAVSHSELSGVRAVAMERFAAWDTFKAEFAGAREEGKRAVPAMLRKLFVRSLISENAAAAERGAPLFRSIINPEYAVGAESFADWISRTLPSLSLWHKKYCAWRSRHADDSDAENADYLLLHERYKRFLEENGLFEPAWGTPEFSSRGASVVIFYPELLADFSDYEEIFSASPDVSVIRLPEKSAGHPRVFVYPDARMELRRTALAIRKTVADGLADWNEIAVDVPDLETYRPYIEREFRNYCIPFVMRTGNSFTVNNAGSVFSHIQTCYAERFSYDSVRALLLNGFVPWKEKDVNESLVREGVRMRCICGYEDGGVQKDSWTAALSGVSEDERERRFYALLKADVIRMCEAPTFAAVREAWFAFRTHFLADGGFSEQADAILGRCLAELDGLVEIEEQFVRPLGMAVRAPFDFFLNEITSKTYRPQEKNAGVSVFDYRLAAGAAYPFHFVINCTQKELSVPFRLLPFLNGEKRRALDIIDSDEASPAFIRLYGAWNSAARGRTVFSCASRSFSGFAIPHTFFEDVGCPADGTPFSELDGGDFFLSEKRWLFGGRQAADVPSALTDLQKRGFFRWHSCAANPDGEEAGRVSAAVERKIGALFSLREERRGGAVLPDVVPVSQDDMANFFPCPRKWLLKKVLALREDTLDAELLNVYEPGIINHKILELVFSDFKKNGTPLPTTEADGTFGAGERALRLLVARCTAEAIHAPEMQFHDSPLVLAMLDSQRQLFERTVCDFLHSFCSSGESGFGGFAVHSVEDWFRAPLDGSCSLFGRADCILCDSNGTVAIVDFKNTDSSVPSINSCRADENGALKNFQIAMYVTLWRMSGRASVPVERAAVCSVSGGKQIVVLDERNSKKTLEQFEPTLQAFRRYCRRFAEKVSAGSFEPVSRPDSIFENLDAYSDCAACDFRAVCRTTFQIAASALSHGAPEAESNVPTEKART